MFCLEEKQKSSYDPREFYFIVDFSCEDGGTKPDNFLRSFLFSSLLSNKDTQNLGSKNRGGKA